MALQGTLDTFALPDVLRLLAATDKTGRLRIAGPRGEGSIWVAHGAVAGLDVASAPHATEPVDALFELLRFDEGSFTFDADVQADLPGEPSDLEPLLDAADALLAEWRLIEAVVPSLDAGVRLCRALDAESVTIGAAEWTTLVAVGSGTTVGQVGEVLGLAEIPVSRAVRDLVELGIAEITDEAPIAPAAVAAADVVVDVDLPPEPTTADEPATAALGSSFAPEPFAARDEEIVEEVELEAVAETTEADLGPHPDGALPAARPIRARRARRAPEPHPSGEPERFVPLDLPGAGSPAAPAPAEAPAAADIDDLAAAFPGLAKRISSSPGDDEVARQLAALSPRASEAVRAAAEATTDEEREAALDEAVEGHDGPINRGLLLKFLSSVKS